MITCCPVFVVLLISYLFPVQLNRSKHLHMTLWTSAFDSVKQNQSSVFWWIRHHVQWCTYCAHLIHACRDNQTFVDTSLSFRFVSFRFVCLLLIFSSRTQDELEVSRSWLTDSSLFCQPYLKLMLSFHSKKRSVMGGNNRTWGPDWRFLCRQRESLISLALSYCFLFRCCCWLNLPAKRSSSCICVLLMHNSLFGDGRGVHRVKTTIWLHFYPVEISD